MDQKKTGSFIAAMRKQQNFTQRDLAEKMGVSDKTISKWETGRSMPDLCYLKDLCEALQISVNELLSGECLSEDDYSVRAEETIMALMKDNDESRKKNRVVRSLAGICLAAVTLLLMFSLTQDGLGGISGLMTFVDIPGFLYVALLSVAVVLLSGRSDYMGILQVLRQTLIPSGAVVMLVGLILIMMRLVDVGMLGANLAVCILSLLYAVCAHIVVVILIEKRGKTDGIK